MLVIEDPDVRSALTGAGWSESRKVDASAWLMQLRSEGYAVTPPAAELLAAVGGLTVEPVLSPSSKMRPGRTVFDPVFAAAGESARVRHWQDALGVPLTPVGEWSDEAVLLVDSRGAMYADVAWRVDLLGCSIQEGLRVAL